VWKTGVILEKNKTYAEVVEYYGKREMRVKIAGMHKKELMAIIKYELDKIHVSYKRLKYDKLIPCNCAECKNKKEPYFYSYEVLQKFYEDGQSQIQCQQSYMMVNVRGLIDDIVGLKSEKEVEEIMAKQKSQQVQSPNINVGSVNISGNAKVDGFNLGGIIQDSFNKAEAADISSELKETLKQLAQAVDAMNKELPPEKSKKVEKYLVT